MVHAAAAWRGARGADSPPFSAQQRSLVLTRRWTRNNDEYNNPGIKKPYYYRNGPAKDTGVTPGTTALCGTVEQAPAII